MVDLATSTGDAIPVEERDPREVTNLGGTRIVPRGTTALKRAFDVTPAALVTAIVTEHGIAHPPFTASLRVLGTLTGA
jgi:methylthioribose-1-phosphate isomerase